MMYYYFSLRVKFPTPNLSGVSVIPKENHVDDRSQHGGRIRAFPHVRGNWVTFIYIDCKLYFSSPKPLVNKLPLCDDQRNVISDSIKDNLSKIAKKLIDFILLFDKSYTLCEDFHISLSKTFVLRYHMIKSFINFLQESLSEVKRYNYFVFNYSNPNAASNALSYCYVLAKLYEI